MRLLTASPHLSAKLEDGCFTLAALLFWAALACSSIVAYRCAPLVTQFAAVQRAIKQTHDANPSSPSEFRREYARQVQRLGKPVPLDPSDLMIQKNPQPADDSRRTSDRHIVAWAYIQDVHLVGQVHLRLRMKSSGYDEAIKGFKEQTAASNLRP